MISAEDCEFIQRFEMKRSPEEKQEMLQTEGSQVSHMLTIPWALSHVIKNSGKILMMVWYCMVGMPYYLTKNLFTGKHLSDFQFPFVFFIKMLYWKCLYHHVYIWVLSQQNFPEGNCFKMYKVLKKMLNFFLKKFFSTLVLMNDVWNAWHLTH